MSATAKAGATDRRRSLDIVAATPPAPPHLIPTNGNRLEGIRVVLAPLCGITDAAFRKICLGGGADLVVSEMISSEGLVRNSRHMSSLRHLDMSDGPLSLQIFGADPEVMAESAAALSRLEPRYIDLNFGCPVKKIVSQRGGSAVLRDLPLLGRICRRAVERSGVPVSAKIRSGWDTSGEESVREIARVIEESGVTMITVHARTRSQEFKGQAEWDLIKAVKDAVSIPVVGNGDVTDGESYLRMKQTTGCDAVMVGRAAIGNPWVFGEIKATIEGRAYAAPTPRDRVEMLLSQVRTRVQYDGEPRGIIASRTIMAGYLKRVPNAREIRPAVMGCTQLGELEKTLYAFLARIEAETPADPSSGAYRGGISLS